MGFYFPAATTATATTTDIDVAWNSLPSTDSPVIDTRLVLIRAPLVDIDDSTTVGLDVDFTP